MLICCVDETPLPNPICCIDIAGTAYTDTEGPHQVKGPTGVGVRLFSELVLKRAGA